MRNIFDQYQQPENRVTHALVTALHEDRKLLLAFLTDIAKQGPSKTDGPIEICEQTYPGTPQVTEAREDEAEQLGIPDAWITAGDKWCLVIENKVLASVTTDQLNRHLATARRRGYTDPQALVLTIRKPNGKISDSVRVVEWREVYRWLLDHARQSPWADRVAKFLEVMEGRMVDTGQLTSGTLTAFNGFQFGAGTPFSYLEAKRVLGLAMAELGQREDLRSNLHIDPALPSRGAIKGREADAVWDILQIAAAQKTKYFTEFPHLTLGIGLTKIDAMVTVPNNVRPVFLRRLVDQDLHGFAKLVSTVLERMQPLLSECPGMEPRLRIAQRHWLSRSATPSYDATIDVDLRTGADGNAPIKNQPQWIAAVHAGLANRNSNLEFQIGAIFPYRTCPKIRSTNALDSVARAWVACKPLLALLIKD